jgi:triosephosphate isomerase
MVTERTKNRVADICRVVLGLTFVFSGFVKAVDPWGVAIKISEYLNVYGFGALGGLRFVAAIAMCAAELMLGLMLVFKVKVRLVSILALCVMTFFTLLTLLSATVLPVEDCGCFGDAVKLSPWGSFAKNVVLWVLAFVVWRDARRTMRIFPITLREWLCMLFFGVISVGIDTYCYLHLPLIDFLPFKTGLNLREALYGESAQAEEGRMVYRDLQDGSEREFAVSDTTWWDSSRWEFVRQVEEPASGIEDEMLLRQFAVLSPEGDLTAEIVNSPARVYMLCAVKLDDIGPGCAARFEDIARRAHEEGAKVVLLTATPLDTERKARFGTAPPVSVYNLDATTMATMLRAEVGMVTLDDGVITDKRNCRDVSSVQ